MEMYYSKQEYNRMKNTLERKIKSLEKKVENLTNKLKVANEDYNILLETASEHVTE